MKNNETLQMAASPTLLVTGATGTIGTALTKLLSERGVLFRAMVRNPGDAQTVGALPGAEVLLGDFDDPATIAQALNGMERAFLLTDSSERAEARQLTFLAEAKRAGLRHIVKLSQLGAYADSPVRFLRYHAVVEQAIRESGIPFTFLRPNLFMQGLLNCRESITGQHKLFASIGEARVSLIDIRDIAAVAAAALTESGHDGQTYTLTGPQALTHTEIADGLSTALGHRIMFVDIPPPAMRDALIKAHLPPWQADGLIEDYAHYSRHEAMMITGTVLATTEPARSFAEFAHDYAPALA